MAAALRSGGGSLPWSWETAADSRPGLNLGWTRVGLFRPSGDRSGLSQVGGEEEEGGVMTFFDVTMTGD